MREFLRGGVRALGIVAGFLPTAVSFGAIAIQTKLSVAATLGLSAWVFAGASQFAAVEGLRQGVAALSIVITVLVINLRHLPMSVAIARHRYAQFSTWQRWLLCHGLVDEVFALEMSDPPRPFAYYLGMHGCCWAAWVAGTWLGCVVGLQIPERWLTFALPALFIDLLVRAVRQLRHPNRWIVLMLSLILAVASIPLGSTGLLVSILGIAAIATLGMSEGNQAERRDEA
jgi:4-azaleucine resistance transporter AzlC